MDTPEDGETLKTAREIIADLDKQINRAVQERRRLESLLAALNMDRGASLQIPPSPDISLSGTVIPGKISSGIPKLDDLLNGGIDIPSNIVLKGPPFSGKEILARNFIAKSISENIPVLIVSVDKDIGKIKSDVMKILGGSVDPEETGLLKFIDAYSKTVQIQSPSKHAIVSEGVSNYSLFIKTIDAASTDMLENYGNFKFLFFTLTGMISQIDPKFFIKTLQHIAQKRRSENAVSLYLMDLGVFDDNVYESANYVMDGEIEFRVDFSKNYLRVRGMGNVKSRDWIEIMFHGNSFDLGSFDLKRVH
ncbi:RAD55 family ATPase [Oxyplasma meridianum]|uniref:RAD55 family ATPase n=1 Tax=Oxyplasma meridianum TaxID=3073602 RepID=A0AAX4NJG9_9ARCH